MNQVSHPKGVIYRAEGVLLDPQNSYDFFPGARESVKFSHGLVHQRLGLVSLLTSLEETAIGRKPEIGQLFDVTSRWVEFGMEDATTLADDFSNVADLLGLEHEDTVVVENSLYGIRGALAACCKAIAIIRASENLKDEGRRGLQILSKKVKGGIRIAQNFDEVNGYIFDHVRGRLAAES